MTRLNFYIAFDNVYDEINTLISGQNTRISRPSNRDMPVWDFSHQSIVKFKLSITY